MVRRLSGLAVAVGLAFAVVVPAQAAPRAADPAPGAFTAVSPKRVLDTRIGVGAPGPVGPAGTLTLDLSASVPATTTAVVLNVTGTVPTADTFVTAYPSGTARPTASNLNLTAGETRANLVTVALGADRKVLLSNHNGSVQLIADLSGYYAPDAAGRFNAYSPVRVMDTRTQFGFRPPGPLGPDTTETLDLTDQVPDSATAVVFNLTGTNATTGTFVTAWPAGTPRPTASNLNLNAGATSPNQVVVALGANQKINLFNKNGNTDLIVDVAGFYTPDYGALFTPMAPRRMLDTRNGGGPVGPGSTLNLGLGSVVPRNTTGVVVNLTGTEGTAGTFVTAWPPPEPRPSAASSLNLTAGQTAANLVTVGVGKDASVSLYNAYGAVHLIADLAGYFSLPPVACASDCVYGWGGNEYGALGTGDYDPASAAAARVYGLSGVVQVASHADTGYALTRDGKVWAWGINYAGQLGNGWRVGKSVVPVPVIGLDDVVAIDAGVALRRDGTVWAWGTAPSGGYDVPAQVPGLTGVTSVSTGGGVVYAVKSDGTVWAWGSNAFGALGIGDPNLFYSATPVQVSGLTGVREVDATLYGALALRTDGTVWGWGDNRQGQVGHGMAGSSDCYNLPPTGVNCQYDAPVQVVNLTGVTAIGADSVHGFAVLGDGTAWAWGSDYSGDLGNGQLCDCPTGTPVRVGGLTGIRDVTGSENGGYALDADGRVWSWGSNDRSALGPVGTSAPNSTTPLRLSAPTGVTHVTGGLLAGFALVP